MHFRELLFLEVRQNIKKRTIIIVISKINLHSWKEFKLNASITLDLCSIACTSISTLCFLASFEILNSIFSFRCLEHDNAGNVFLVLSLLESPWVLYSIIFMYYLFLFISCFRRARRNQNRGVQRHHSFFRPGAVGAHPMERGPRPPHG